MWDYHHTLFWVHVHSASSITLWKIRLPQGGRHSSRFKLSCQGSTLSICDLSEDRTPTLWVLYGEFSPIIYSFEGTSLRGTFNFGVNQMYTTSQGEVLVGSSLFWNGIVQEVTVPRGPYSFCPVRREFGFLRHHRGRVCFRTASLCAEGGAEIWGHPHQTVQNLNILRHRTLVGTGHFFQRIEPWPFERSLQGDWFDLGPRVFLRGSCPFESHEKEESLVSTWSHQWAPVGPLYSRQSMHPSPSGDWDLRLFRMFWDRAEYAGIRAPHLSWSPLGAACCGDLAWTPNLGSEPQDSSLSVEDWLGGRWGISQEDYVASLPYSSGDLCIDTKDLDLGASTFIQPFFKFFV